MIRLRRASGWVFAAFAFTTLGAPAVSAAEWVSLFDGKTMSGWTKAGGKAEKSKWEVVDGAIVSN